MTTDISIYRYDIGRLYYQCGPDGIGDGSERKARKAPRQKRGVAWRGKC